jgi:hypothetical protein
VANYKKKCRDALVAALSDGTNGFNAKLGAIAASYDIPLFSLEFGAESKNVAFGYLDPEEVDVSRIFEFPGAVIYSTESVNENKIKFSKFSGFVNAYVVFYLRYRALDDPDTGSNQPTFGNDMEKYPDAVEDAMNEALHAGRSTMCQLGVLYEDYRADRDPVQTFGDGHVQILTFTLGMVVHVQ